MIILTATQAERVRGRAPAKLQHALDPVPLRDGTFMLGEQVLDDEAHADVRDFLAALPKRTVAPAERYGTDEARREQDIAEIRSRNIPDYRERVRPPPDDGTPRVR